MTTAAVTLSVRLLHSDAAWISLLEQIGIPATIGIPAGPEPISDALLIINADPSAEEHLRIAQFQTDNGIVLVTPSADSLQRAEGFHTEHLAYHLPKRTPLYEHSDLLDIDAAVRIFGNNDIVAEKSSGNGASFFLGLEPSLFHRFARKRRSFPAKNARLPNEIVARRSHGAFRQLITSLLATMFHRRGLPFVHRWYFPDGAPSLFTFRIDSDKGTKEQIDEIRHLSDRYEVPTTWYLDVKSHELWLEHFRDFGRQEIGVHCYEHVLHPGPESNRDNFAKALSLLRQHGLTPHGITAPTGGWSAPYAEAIRSLGFEHSSEFSFDRDDLPLTPVLNGERFPILQLPIHPICVGSLLRARMTEEQMADYFLAVAQRNIARSEPVCLYHHPTHRCNSVFEPVFQYIRERSIPMLNSTEYAEWWNARTGADTSIGFHNGAFSITGTSPVGLHHRILLPDGKSTVVRLSDGVTMDQLNFTTSAAWQEPIEPWEAARRFDPRHWIQNALDWWITVTE